MPAPVIELVVGTEVCDGVTLVRPLGKGGMGSVWVARHRRLDCEVAVKFVAAELVAKDASVLERFHREARLASRIKSPHVVKTFDHGVMRDGRPYIVMELLVGESLGAWLVRSGRLTLRQTAKVISQIASVLEEAHAMGVVHRDIKPDNAYLTDAGYDAFVKVLDFGIAKDTRLPAPSEVTSTGAIVGTPEYMSPEQLLTTSGVDHRSDLWSLAVLAYHMLTGRVPFVGETLPSLSLAICNADYDPPSELAPELPSGTDAWFVRALAPDRAARFQAAGELAASLRGVLLGDDAEPESRIRPAGAPSSDSGASSPRMALAAGSQSDPALGELVSDRIASAPRSDTAHATTLRANTDPSQERLGMRAAMRVPPFVRIAAVVLAALGLAGGAFAVLGHARTSEPRGPARGAPGTEAAPRDPWDETGGADGSSVNSGSAADGGRLIDNGSALNGGSLVDGGAQPSARAASSSAPASSSDTAASAEVAPVPAPSAAEPGASTAPAASATASTAPGSAAPPAWAHGSRGGGRPNPETSARATKPGCENPFQLDADGDLVPKPGCM